METIRVGTRSSALALWQAQRVVALLAPLHAGRRFEIVELSTRGDRNRATPLQLIGGVGFFVKELELALLEHNIDLAVHSLKDLPSCLPPALALGAIPARGDPRDALVSATGAKLMDLPTGARVGTGSPRRRAQILALRPDLEVVPIRGNVDTRLIRFADRNYDALVLAVAGLVRLGRESAISEVFRPELMLPAAGQGALAVEVRAGDEQIRSLVRTMNDRATWAAVTAERAFMARLGGGCHVPAAAFAQPWDEQLWLRGLVSSYRGQRTIRGERYGSPEAAEAIGKALADDLLDQGAEEFLGGTRE